jgi:hypothetical protein
MNLINEDRPFHIDPTILARLHSIDIAVASRTSLPVLITGPSPVALPAAIEIAVGDDEGGAEGVVVVDAGDDRYLRSILQRAMSPDRGRVRAVVIHCVEALDETQQAAVMALVADLSSAPAGACRLITTTSVSLFDRVVEGRFDPELFYRLNEIHIKLDDACLPDERSRWAHTN